MKYQIAHVAKVTGIPRNTLLAWERRYSVVQPQRLPNGYRMYTEADVELFRRVKQLVDEGHRVGTAIRLLKSDESSAKTDTAHALETDRRRDELLNALLDYDRPRAERIRHRLTSLTFRAILRSVYLPILGELGDRWAAGTATVAQEHFASAFFEEQMLNMLTNLRADGLPGPKVVAAGFPGEHHALGLLAVCIELALRDHRITYLGPDLPTDDLISAVCAASPPTWVIESVMRSTVADEDILRHAATVATALPSTTVLVIGGPGVEALVDRSTDRLWFCPTLDDFQERVVLLT